MSFGFPCSVKSGDPSVPKSTALLFGNITLYLWVTDGLGLRTTCIGRMRFTIVITLLFNFTLEDNKLEITLFNIFSSEGIFE